MRVLLTVLLFFLIVTMSGGDHKVFAESRTWAQFGSKNMKAIAALTTIVVIAIGGGMYRNKLQDPPTQASSRSQNGGTGNAVLCYLNSPLLSEVQTSLDCGGRPLHATIALRVNTVPNATKQVEDWVRSQRGAQMSVVMSHCNIQRDGNGVAYSLNIVLQNNGPVMQMKELFSQHVPDMNVHDRYFPRAGHVTVASSRRCPQLFQNQALLEQTRQRVNALISNQAVDIYAVGFPERTIQIR